METKFRREYSKQRETNRVKTEASSLRQGAVKSSDETNLPNAHVEFVSADLSQDLDMNRRFERQTPSQFLGAEKRNEEERKTFVLFLTRRLRALVGQDEPEGILLQLYVRNDSHPALPVLLLGE
ncbi:hypothetical protein PsorP6_010061 [Peronosclerospora sorghi]|uniref:Uncharacterized protein n=1 Tax=Peronosclerospora sorghi TaxID=230839 RepID=A0ACC0VWG4_9STRA|nr:hypothetical protein PsorP6_010061 [Peronosclerospora sorghi]